jgi:hypothetical protein
MVKFRDLTTNMEPQRRKGHMKKRCYVFYVKTFAS